MIEIGTGNAGLQPLGQQFCFGHGEAAVDHGLAAGYFLLDHRMLIGWSSRNMATCLPTLRLVISAKVWSLMLN